MNSIASAHPRVIRPSYRWLFGMVGLVVLFFAGYWPRHMEQRKLDSASIAQASALPRVKTTTAVAVDAGRSLTLPGNFVAIRQALVSARATGYVARLAVDIGDRVRAGDVLAELDTPELNQQLAQARGTLNQRQAALEQAIANRDYAQLTAKRQDALLPGITTQQQVDQAHAQVKIDEANVGAARADIEVAQADVRELIQLVSFGRVVAPFAGRITQRNVDVGSLVVAGGQPLFQIEAIDPMRVFVQVPQSFAASVKEGETASVSIRELPGRAFDGRVTRTAGTLDPATRTLNTEIDVPNPNGELLGGMFADVSIAVALQHRTVRVPASAVITDAQGVHVATVDRSDRVELVAVQRGTDNGAEIDLVDGLAGGEQVLVNPGGAVSDGMRVEAVGESR
jgi:membrane fusion protein (multidrug efflux system)